MLLLKGHVGKHMSTGTRRAWEYMFLLSLRRPSGLIPMISLTSTFQTHTRWLDQPDHLGFQEYVSFSGERETMTNIPQVEKMATTGELVWKANERRQERHRVEHIPVALCLNHGPLPRSQSPSTSDKHCSVATDFYPHKNVACQVNFHGRSNLCPLKKKALSAHKFPANCWILKKRGEKEGTNCCQEDRTGLECRENTRLQMMHFNARNLFMTGCIFKCLTFYTWGKRCGGKRICLTKFQACAQGLKLQCMCGAFGELLPIYASIFLTQCRSNIF